MAILNQEHHKLSENINYIPFVLPDFLQQSKKPGEILLMSHTNLTILKPLEGYISIPVHNWYGKVYIKTFSIVANLKKT